MASAGCIAGKVCVVTGGGSGIGTALCRRFAELGASKVVVADMDESSARRVAEEIGGIAVRCNVAVEMDMRRLIVTAEAEAGPIDVFVGNAGIPSNGGPEVPNDEWDRIIQVNVLQHVYAARHLMPLWKERPEAEKFFVVTASAAGLLTQVGSLPYSVTKHAAVGLAEWFAITYKEIGVHVSCLCPQQVRTGMAPEGDVLPGGTLAPEKVAQDVVDALGERRFLVLPHPEVLKYIRRKTEDYDKWISGMGKLNNTLGKLMGKMPNLSAAKL